MATFVEVLELLAAVVVVDDDDGLHPQLLDDGDQQQQHFDHNPDDNDEQQPVIGLGHDDQQTRMTCIEDNEVIHDAVPLASSRPQKMMTKRNLDAAELTMWQRAHDTIPQ